jgi:L-2-hydroxyglutarate oxidase LhgO
VDESSKSEFVRSIRTWFPGLDERKLQPGYAGIRPRLAKPEGGFADFRITGPAEHGVPGLVHLFGIDSPGLTSCLSLAKYVADSLD